MPHFFAYGDRMSEEKMLSDLPGARLSGAAHVDGYRLAFNVMSRSWGGGAANAVFDPGSRLWGVLWEVGDDDFARLDSFRGPNDTPHRVVDVLAHGPDGPVQARTFVVDSDAGYIRPTDRYLQMLRSVVTQRDLPFEALDAIDRADQHPQGPAPTI
ncbi:MAG: gamma-glutamylcyclotransferase family protein [Actinomycetota bacterium]